MKKNSSKKFALAFLIVISMSIISYAQIHSATSAHTTYTGLSMTGYQGWFGAPGDGGTNSWRHYNGSDGFQPGSASIEYWPDMREADEDEKYLTSFAKTDGTPCYVFSSVHPKTVNRHFQWMKEYGIDGAFMQRFRSDFGIRSTMNKILANALVAAREHNRAIGLMYDIGANIHVNGVPNDAKRTEEVNKIFNDWRELIDDLGLTTGGENQPYLYHNGKPLIVLWGVGFTHRHTPTGLDMQYWVELVDSLQNSSEYGGCAIMLGVPTYWRAGGSDCVTGTEHRKMLQLINTVDIIQPWHTSRFSRNQMNTTFKNLVKSDLVWCQEHGVDYVPTISPGIREKILHGNNYEQPREGGYYFWDMARAALEAGSTMFYLGMFDEVDEGTQYHKIDNNPPFYSDKVGFAAYGNDPEDHYLRLAGEATRALRGEFIMGTTFRERADAANWQSGIEFVDQNDFLEMFISSDASGRKVYYADPYKVPDGAPTVGTLRDASLFTNELTGTAVRLGEENRGLYIRFVEVDENTDQVLAYRAVAPFLTFGHVPYNTGFEEGVIDPRVWAVETDNETGRVQVTKEHAPYNGAFHLTMDVAEDGHYSTNAVLLHLNLAKVTTRLDLNFYWKIFAESDDDNNGIYFSDDKGASFFKVYNLIGGRSDYQLISLNINELAVVHGLSLTETFIIKFQHRSNSPIPADGCAFDNVSVSFNSEKSGFAQFLASDGQSQGTWTARYGFEGQAIVGKEVNLPDYASIFWDVNSKTVVWEDSSSDVRGLIFDKTSSIRNRILAARYADEADPWRFTVDVGDSSHNVSMYFLDGDEQDRRFILQVFDASNGDVYDVQTIKDFQNGKWITWNVRGRVTFMMKLLSGPGAVVSGIFFDPATPVETEFIDILKDRNGGFEKGLDGWRFFEVPTSLGSKAEIIQGDVVEGANAVKLTFMDVQAGLADRALDRWDARIPMQEGVEYFAELWAKTETPGEGKLNITYGFFNALNNIITEAGVWFELTEEYQKYDFKFTAPKGTKNAWLAFRWKKQNGNFFLPGIVYLDHVQLLKKDTEASIDEIFVVPHQIMLDQNYPNPFNPTTTITFSLPEASHIILKLYNIIGREIKTLIDEPVSAGHQKVVWDGTDSHGDLVSNGLYIYQLESKYGVMTKKMTVVK